MENITFEEIQKAHNKRQNRIAITILVAGTIVSFAIFGPKDKIKEEAEITPAAIVETVIMGEEGSQTAKLEKTAVLESDRSAEAIAEYTGRIKQVNFEIGSAVFQGEVLAVFDQAATENTAKINLDSAQKSFELAEKNLQKTKELLKTEIGRGDEAAKIQVNNARLQKEQAELQLEQARIAFGKTVIKAPVSGKVISKNVAVNDFVSAGQVVAQISGAGNAEAAVSLNAEQIKRIKAGDKVSIIISGETFAGEVASLSAIAGSGERYEVRIRSNDNLSNQINKAAKITFNLRLDGEKADSFFVPLEAVTIGQRKTEVFVAENGKAKSREIKTGEVIGSKIEIIAGLQAGDKVVVKNGRNLQDGQEITIAN